MVTRELDVGAFVRQPVDIHCVTQEHLAVFEHSEEEEGRQPGDKFEETDIVSFSVAAGNIEA